MKTEAVHAARGRSFYLRLPILIYMAYVFVRHLVHHNYQSVLYPLTVGTHELGNFTFSWIGGFMGVIGGLVFQLGVPVVSIINFYFLGDFFALFFSFGWLSTSLFLVARFITDARLTGEALIGPFSERNIIKDWNYFLTRADLLPYAGFIALFCKVLACLAMLICLIGGLWFLIQTKKHSSRAKA